MLCIYFQFGHLLFFLFFFFNDTATTEIYTLSLHDALPISRLTATASSPCLDIPYAFWGFDTRSGVASIVSSPSHSGDRKSTRLNSSHSQISYAVFCLKKKKKNKQQTPYILDYIPLLTISII